jgi:hypothetical protein
LLVAPDVLRTICDEVRLLASVAATFCDRQQSLKERLVAFKGAVDALVDRALPAVSRLLQRVDDADEGDLSVLTLVALLAARLRVREPAQTSVSSLSTGLSVAAPPRS